MAPHVMMTATEAEIERAFAAGLSGFSGVASPAFLTTAIARVQVADWAAGPWTVTLPQMRAATTGRPNVELQQLLTRAFLRWGNGGAAGGAEALIDYPIGGAVCTVHGAYVEVQIQPISPPVAFLPGGGGLPLVGAMISRGAATSRVSSLTLTTPTTNVLFAQGADYVRPAHSVAYRLYANDFALENVASACLIVSQLDGATNQIVYDRVSQAGTYPWFGQAMPTAPAVDMGGGIDLDTWIPLHPSATRVRVARASSDNIAVGVQWLLHLG